MDRIKGAAQALGIQAEIAERLYQRAHAEYGDVEDVLLRDFVDACRRIDLAFRELARNKDAFERANRALTDSEAQVELSKYELLRAASSAWVDIYAECEKVAKELAN